MELTASDGHKFSAYKASPAGNPVAGLVVIQEIFGVNPHIQDVCDRYAEQGYLAIAPALFDRISPNITLDYESDDVTQGIDYKMQISDEQALLDIDAARAAIASAGPVNVVGYCWGGSLAYLSACRLPDFNKAVGYYGGQVAQNIDETPQIPVMLHFGDQDASIPLKSVDEVMTKRPDIPVYIYQAGHGFNCDRRGSYDAASAKLALDRTLEFFG
ncbi:MAG: dienelactone hydrolase family protein [Proteobacteria bacterium]|nr:dienelactone hydrolase family protein [Pseudomonadota bacterium]